MLTGRLMFCWLPDTTDKLSKANNIANSSLYSNMVVKVQYQPLAHKGSIDKQKLINKREVKQFVLVAL
jgi:hypothetical protein